ncbi:uncharacterized protein LOC125234176 [Leguminivora glycinivorella]|uniref:uncharacterized protein LOC125234176 n=1 Tax=Leguminivora glycinivorella TaxID=1035111 RepID=UPI00200E47D8|nr:uncharacterized protein LOC125234176 [Leguminivora glycinivorella]
MLSASLLLLILSVVRNSAVPIASDLKSDDVFLIQPDYVGSNGTHASLNGVLFKTVMRYHCLPIFLLEGSHVILYGSNGWTFPEQDVNLTLTYPTSNPEVQRNLDNDKIVGYEVLLFTDTRQCTGTIAGELMQEHITLNFTISGITMLSYEFWLYGVPSRWKGKGDARMDLDQNNIMC